MSLTYIYEDSLEKVGGGGEEYSMVGHPQKDDITYLLTNYMSMAQIYEDSLEKVGGRTAWWATHTKTTRHSLLTNYMSMVQIYEDSLDKVGEENSMVGHPQKDDIT
jgi:hypothetical protein